MDRFINYAHRGASAYAPGNTLSAFYLGLACGANGIETDVRASRDGVLMLFHDKTLESVGEKRPGLRLRLRRALRVDRHRREMQNQVGPACIL